MPILLTDDERDISSGDGSDDEYVPPSKKARGDYFGEVNVLPYHLCFHIAFHTFHTSIFIYLKCPFTIYDFVPFLSIVYAV